MNSRIPNELIEQIRTKIDIVDIIGEYISLKNQGKNLIGLCPFHDEKTPSFSVRKDKQFFHCFGCKKGGNVFNFLMEIEGFSYVEAIKFLAERLNMTLPNINNRNESLSEESSVLLEAYEWLTKYYTHLIKYSEEGKKALAYLKKRNITMETIERFEMGFSPINSDVTVQFLQQKNFHVQSLVKSGVLTKREGRYNDPFRGRVVFPIRNHLGKTVGYGGRALNDEKPKYLNSPENELFKKSNLLFNFDLAKNEIRKEDKVVIFEGYMDVFSAAQSGMNYVVATLGTSLSETHARLLQRYVNQVILCFDGDEAGINGTFHAGNLLRKYGRDVRVASIKEGLDADDYIKKHGIERFEREIIDSSDTFFAFLMNYKKRSFNLSVDSDKIAYIEEIVKELANIESPIEIEFYVNDLADEFAISRERILADVEQFKKRNKNMEDKYNRNSNTNVKYFNQAKQILPAFHNAEKKLLAYMIKDTNIIPIVRDSLGLNFNINEHQIILTHLYALFEQHGRIDVSELIDQFEEKNIRQLISELSILEINYEINERELNDYISVIKYEKNDLSILRKLKKQQKLYEQQNNIEEAVKVGMEIIELESKMKNN